MSGKLSLPRLSLREHFAALFHEQQFQPALALQANYAYDGHSVSPARSFLDKGKARAIEAIDSIVDSMLYTKSPMSSALAEASSQSQIGSAASMFDPARSEHDLMPPSDPRRPSSSSERPSASSPGPSRRRDQQRPSSGGPPHDERRSSRPKQQSRPREFAKPRQRNSDSLRWQYGQGVNAAALPSRRLDPRLAEAGDNILRLIDLGDSESVQSALSNLTNLYKTLEDQGSLKPLSSTGTAIRLSNIAHLGKTTDHLIFIRHLLASIFTNLRKAFTQTTGSIWNSRKRERLKIQNNIAACLFWIFEHSPLTSLISFHNPHLAIASRMCIMSLDAPLKTADKFVQDLLERRMHDAISGVYQVFILALVTSDRAYLAFDLYKDATERGFPVREVVGRKLARVLSVERNIAMADQTFDMILQQGEMQEGPEFVVDTDTLETRLSHNARAGRADQVEADLNLIAERSGAERWIQRARSHLFAEVAAVQGDIEGCDAALAETFDLECRRGDYPAEGKRRPSRVANSQRIQARISAQRLGEAEQLLDHMLRVGQVPSARAFEELMAASSKLEDVLLARRILDSHQKLGYPLNAPLLVSLMHIYARRHDAEGAQRALDFMMELGLSVPVSAFNALMLAHVEASDWKSAFNVFRNMDRAKQIGRRPNRRSHEILLKALVMSGSSVTEVLKFVEVMKQNGAEFDARTYALIIQSACDAGTIGLALEMFDAADQTLEGGADEFHFSIIINGLLRQGKGLRAKKYFDLMQTRGLQPSHVTYAMLVQQHARMGTDEDMEKASRVATWALSELEDVPLKGSMSQANLSAMLYMPILRAEVNRGNSVAAEDTLGDMGNASGMTAIRCLTILLDLYRRDGRVQAAMETWYQLLTLGCAEQWTTLLQVLSNRVRMQLNKDGTPRVESERLRNPSSLCLPLSIIMDALSTAGLYDEAVQAWKVVRDLGGRFDPDNWNVLMAVHAEAGRLEDALEILEHVLREVPPNWDWLREQAKLGVFVPQPDESINLLEDVMGPKGLAQLSDRRDEKRVFEDVGRSDSRRRRDSGEEEGVEEGEGEGGMEGRVDEYADESFAFDSDADSDFGHNRRSKSRREIEGEEDDFDERDVVSVALARRTTIDSCFWFAHEKKLVVLVDALNRQNTASDGQRGGKQDDWKATQVQERQRGRFISQAEIRQRYPSAARILHRYRRRQQYAAHGPPQNGPASNAGAV